MTQELDIFSLDDDLGADSFVPSIAPTIIPDNGTGHAPGTTKGLLLALILAVALHGAVAATMRQGASPPPFSPAVVELSLLAASHARTAAPGTSTGQAPISNQDTRLVEAAALPSGAHITPPAPPEPVTPPVAAQAPSAPLTPATEHKTAPIARAIEKKAKTKSVRTTDQARPKPPPAPTVPVQPTPPSSVATTSTPMLPSPATTQTGPGASTASASLGSTIQDNTVEPGYGGTSGGADSGGTGPMQAAFGDANGPRFVRRVMPVFPRQARRSGREGFVMLQLRISARGELLDVFVVHKAGHGFDEEALRAVQASSYAPARHNGRDVECSALLPVRFSLRDG